MILISAAKLGRRSHKMRELISEASRTIEDSQTAQALHGLLSLKSPECSSSNADFPTLLRAVNLQSSSQSIMSSSSLQSPEATMTMEPSKSGPNKVLRAALGQVAVLNSSAATQMSTPLQLVYSMQPAAATSNKMKTIKPRVQEPSISIMTPECGTIGDLSNSPLLANIKSESQYKLFVVAPNSNAGSRASLGSTGSTFSMATPGSGDGSQQQTIPLQLIATSQGMVAVPQAAPAVKISKRPALLSKSSPKIAIESFTTQSPLMTGQQSTATAATWAALNCVTGPTPAKRLLLSTSQQQPQQSTVDANSLLGRATASSNISSAGGQSNGPLIISVNNAGEIISIGNLSVRNNSQQEKTILQSDSLAEQLRVAAQRKVYGSLDTTKPTSVLSSHPVNILPRLAPAQTEQDITTSSQDFARNLGAGFVLAGTSSNADLISSDDTRIWHASADGNLQLASVQDVEAALLMQIQEGYEKSFWNSNMNSSVSSRSPDGAGLIKAELNGSLQSQVR